MSLLKKQTFKYGWCYSDHKDGGNIRTDYDRQDYIFDDAYQGFIEESFLQLGLHLPNEADVFRGTDHDMLFLDSHGVVLKIGKMSAQDFVNPGMLQPIGWLEDTENSKLSIVIYPGVQHLLEQPSLAYPNINPEMKEFILRFGNRGGDCNKFNLGVVGVNGEKKPVPILLDIDTTYNRPCREYIRSFVSKEFNKPIRTSKKISNAIQTQINIVKDDRSLHWDFNRDSFLKLFEYHHPLRNAFFMALEKADGTKRKVVDPKKMNRFWQMAKNFHEQGYNVYQKDKKTVRRLYSQWANLNKEWKKSSNFKDKSFECQGEFIQKIPKDHMTKKIAQSFLAVSGGHLRHLNRSYFSKEEYKELCFEAVKQDSVHLTDVPKDVPFREEIEIYTLKKICKARTPRDASWYYDAFVNLWSRYEDRLLNNKKAILRELEESKQNNKKKKDLRFG